MRVRELRLQRGWSQEHLADLVDVTVRTIQRIERGFKPCLETSKALASVLEVDISTFTGDTTPAQEPSSTKQTDEEAVARLYVKGVKEFYNHLVLYVCVAVIYSYLNIFHGMGDTAIIFFGISLWGFGLLIHGLVAFEKINFMGLGNQWEEQAIAKKRGRKL
jgi:transcriptional regulator with XRE-family HTH domain